MSVEFLVTSLIVILLPGTGVLYTLAIALGRGFRASVAAAFGCTIGIVPSALASIAGLAAIFHSSALAFQAIKYAGVAYLLYLAWTMVKAGGALDLREDRSEMSLTRTAIAGALINTLNPKLSFFFLAFLPQFVDVNDPRATLSMLLLAGVFMVLTFMVFVGYGATASLARRHVIARPGVMAWVRRSFAATFALLGLKLALTSR
ncbi:MAG: LysE family translocator [Notoacmeibacter sp.]|nr:LysE family translocator [Notoacmeibacter sp.]